MKTADCLLVIDAPFENSIFFPSKLVDYMGANKYVLGITPENGTASKIIKNIGGKIVNPNEENKIYEAIINIYYELKKLISFNEDYLKTYFVRGIKKLKEILN